MKKAGGSDSKYFSTAKKGETMELREELRSPQRDRKRDAVKKVWDCVYIICTLLKNAISLPTRCLST
ncbi:hypothetical protein EON64_15460 [archaeon]|nr:MAG: hypothetical protein EON64_15460 [archaeon]